uniref:ribosomal protein L23 n=1 Tax=Gormaniella terricola TaxID=2904618 RepID=UPI0021CCDF1F|nr:ribosomal protein L23 [Gormaniella terricola]UWV18285.1 ribosomal protein L23 [Gormaniella terricola]
MNKIKNSISQKKQVFTTEMLFDLIKYPILNFKSYKLLSEQKQYTFDVDLRLTKPQIQSLFLQAFGVNVIEVNTLIPPRKKRKYTAIAGYKNRFKRVFLTLKEDQSIPYVDLLMNSFLEQMLQKMASQNAAASTDEPLSQESSQNGAASTDEPSS